MVNTALAWAALITAVSTILIAWQAIKQASATKKSAEAASDNAKTLAAVERPWVLETVDNGTFIKASEGPSLDIPVVVTFRNFGRTPAWVTETRTEYKDLDIDRLSEEPDFEESSRHPRLGEIALVPHPDSEIVRAINVSRSEFNQARQRKKFLYIYGFIHYRDGQGDTHDAGFCYRLHIDDQIDPRTTGFYPYPAGKRYVYWT